MKKFYFSFLILGSIPAIAFGYDFSKVSGVLDFACSMFNFLFGILVFATAVFVLWSAFDYLTANGDSKKINEAGKKLMYAVIAILVGIAAKYVPYLAADIMDVTIDPNETSCLES